MNLEKATADYGEDTATTIVSLDHDDLALVYSKTLVDALPITTTKVDGTPCMDPSLNAYSPAAAFYPAERDASR